MSRKWHHVKLQEESNLSHKSRKILWISNLQGSNQHRSSLKIFSSSYQEQDFDFITNVEEKRTLIFICNTSDLIIRHEAFTVLNILVHFYHSC